MNSEDEEDDPKPEKLPIYRKGKEIFDMVNKIAALIPENNEYLMEIKGQMLCDAALLTVKVAGAEAGGLYDLKMENAAIIRKAATRRRSRQGQRHKDSPRSNPHAPCPMATLVIIPVCYQIPKFKE